MADEVIPPIVVEAPVVVAEAPIPAAVVAEAPVVAAEPAVVAEPPPAEVPSLIEGMGEKPVPVEAPKVEEAPAVEPPKEGDPKPAVEAKPEEKPKEPEKAADAPKEGEPKVEAKPAEPVKSEPFDYGYKVPEIITMDDAQKGELHEALDSFRADPKAGAQKLLDMHAKSVQAFADHHTEQTLRNQIKTFNATRREWQIAADADPEIGGPAKDTARAAIARVRDSVISTAKPGTPQHAADVQAFNEFCRVTGAGDNPTMLKMFHRMARFLDEPPPPPPGGKPPATNGANPNATRSQRMYPNTNFGRKAS